jgi:hypothetical protein
MVDIPYAPYLSDPFTPTFPRYFGPPEIYPFLGGEAIYMDAAIEGDLFNAAPDHPAAIAQVSTDDLADIQADLFQNSQEDDQ